MSDSVIQLKRNESNGRLNLAPELQKIARAFEEPPSVFDFDVDWENEVLGPDESIRLVGDTRNAAIRLMEVFSVVSLPTTLMELASLKSSCLVIKSKLRLIRDWGFDFEYAKDDLVLNVLSLEELSKLDKVKNIESIDPEVRGKLNALYLEVSKQVQS